jgi:hypothetical protein
VNEVEFILKIHKGVSIGMVDGYARAGGIEFANVIKHSV